MPWLEVSAVSQRCEFVRLASAEVITMRELCRRFGVSPKTGYKWLNRYRQMGPDGLKERSRRPHRSPRRTSAEVEEAVLSERDAHPAWGGRKIRARLQNTELEAIPSASTVTEILRRHGKIDSESSTSRRPFQRFEAEAPNALWQMDFKGHFATGRGRCHPLTVLDDCTRFSLGLRACGNERGETVQANLTQLFERYGLPDRMLMDNGAPWGGAGGGEHSYLSRWIIRLGIRVTHGRPYHPQTQGKDERFHRTLQVELLANRTWRDLDQCQSAFDGWREMYNQDRPHQALGMAVPASRYRPSSRPFPRCLPAIEYGPDDIVRKVQGKGEIHYRGETFRVGKAFHGYPVGLRPTSEDGVLDVYFCHQRVSRIDLTEQTARRSAGIARK